MVFFSPFISRFLSEWFRSLLRSRSQSSAVIRAGVTAGNSQRLLTKSFRGLPRSLPARSSRVGTQGFLTTRLMPAPQQVLEEQSCGGPLFSTQVSRWPESPYDSCTDRARRQHQEPGTGLQVDLDLLFGDPPRLGCCAHRHTRIADSNSNSRSASRSRSSRAISILEPSGISS